MYDAEKPEASRRPSDLELDEFSIVELEERLEFAVSCDRCNNNCNCPPPPPQ